MSRFVGSYAVVFVELLLAGLVLKPNEAKSIDWHLDPTFKQFRTHVLREEGKMEGALRSVTYCVDDENTLRLVTLGKHPEKVSYCSKYLIVIWYSTQFSSDC